MYIRNLKNVSKKEFREYYKMYYYYKLETFARFNLDVFIFQTVCYDDFVQMHNVKISSEVFLCPNTFTLNVNNN